jgi:aldose 1-epimerase
MNFVVERQLRNGFELVRLVEISTGTYVTLNPGAGALLHEFVIRSGAGEINVIDNYGDETELNTFLSLSYKGSKLSPFACRIPKGRWNYQDTTFEFPDKFKDGSAIHGLLFNQSFNIVDEFADDEMAAVTLRYHYKATNPGYPFEYVCEIRYILQPGNVLQLETTITNLDDEEIPLVDGWHPYFNLGSPVDDYVLQFGSAAMLEFSEELIPTGNILEEPSFQVPHRLGDREIDNCYVLNEVKGQPSCIVYNPLTKISLTIFASELYRYLQVFTPKHRQSIALENLSGAPDSFNNGIGLIYLQPRRSATFNVWYRLEMAE